MHAYRFFPLGFAFVFAAGFARVEDARRAGIDVATFTTALDNHTYADALAAEQAAAKEIDISATPSFLIIEVATAKQLGTLKVGDGAAENVIGGVIDAQTMVIVAPAEDAWKMQWLSFPVGKAPSFGRAKTISKCP